MKNKLKLLLSVGLLAGQMLMPGLSALAAEPSIVSMPVPVDEYGPEMYISRINFTEKRVYVYYENRGALEEGARFRWATVFWPKTPEKIREELPDDYPEDYVFDYDEMAMEFGTGYERWAGWQYAGDELLPIDGGEQYYYSKWPQHYPLADNPYNVLYFSMNIINANNEYYYWVGKADYGDCMNVWQEGVECRAQIQEDGSLKYLAYLDGELIQDEQVDDSEDNGETDVAEDSENNEPREDNEPHQKDNEFSEDTAVGPVLLAGVGSAVVDSGSGGDGGSVPTGGVVPVVDDETVEDEAADNEIDEEVEVVAGLAEDNLEVPELGGEQKNFWPLVLGAFAVTAGVLMLWWWVIVPLLKRRENEEEASKTTE